MIYFCRHVTEYYFYLTFVACIGVNLDELADLLITRYDAGLPLKPSAIVEFGKVYWGDPTTERTFGKLPYQVQRRNQDDDPVFQRRRKVYRPHYYDQAPKGPLDTLPVVDEKGEMGSGDEYEEEYWNSSNAPTFDWSEHQYSMPKFFGPVKYAKHTI